MQFAITVGLLFLVGAVVADERTLVESLEKRAEALVLKVKSSLDGFKKDHANLISTLETQFDLADSFVISLKEQLANNATKFESAQVHVIEEDLLQLENQVSTEIKNINETITGHKATPNVTHSALVQKALDLVKLGQDALTKHRSAPEAHWIDYEIQAIQFLIKTIEAKPAAAELAKDEQQLARHEKTLNGLIDQANHRIPKPLGPKPGK